jgi:hypothetical protein
MINQERLLRQLVGNTIEEIAEAAAEGGCCENNTDRDQSAIRPYSIAVAPDSSCAKRAKMFITRLHYYVM